MSDRPAFFVSYDGHTGWANSPALLAAGLTRATKDPPGGVIVRDADGEPTGALKEEPAMAPVRRLIPRPEPGPEGSGPSGRASPSPPPTASPRSTNVAFREDDLPVFEHDAAETGFKVRVYSALPLVQGPERRTVSGLAPGPREGSRDRGGASEP